MDAPAVTAGIRPDRGRPLALAPLAGRFAAACGGFALLGLCAGFGAGDHLMAARSIPSGLGVGLGSLVLTAPALVVGHQLLRLQASPETLVETLVRGFSRSGVIALGLAPAALFFSATSRLGLVLLAVSVAGAGALGLLATMRDLLVAEGVEVQVNPGRAAATWMLVLGWAGLTVLIAGRLAFDVGRFVLGF